jgi:hypothetical protein
MVSRQDMETTKKNVCIKVPNPDELGYGIDGKFTRQKWQDECKKMLLAGKEEFNKWQDTLIASETSPGSPPYIDRQQLNLKPVYFIWKISYANNSKPDKTVDWSATKSSLVVDLANQVFDEELNLDGYNFQTDVWFGGVTFNKQASFKHTVFQKKACFLGITFNDEVSFRSANFHNELIFNDSIFGGEANFKKSRFRAETTSFKRVEFLSVANFEGAEFDNFACFDGAHFSKEANFAGKVYVNNDEKKDDKLQTFNSISFSGAHFENRAVFNNRDFRGTTSFGKYEDQPTKFDLAPLFHNCKLFQGTTFVDAEFGISNSDEAAAQAFNTLKHVMSQQQSTRDEHNFIKKELDTERLRAKGGKRVLYRMYWKISDYGFSVWKPFRCLLLGPFLFASLIYGLLSWLNNCNPLFSYSCQIDVGLSIKIIELSLLQSLPPLGLDKLSESLREDLFVDNSRISLLVALVGIQKVLALAGWFFVALALRNLFKMK